MNNKTKTYLAFISYKHEDKKYAKWLQEKLESFRLPTYLQEQRPDLPDYPRPIFRDETDLELGTLSENIHRALDSSRFLIVICSPRSTQSKYVEDEICYFKDHCDSNNIIPFIIEGIPFSNNPETECFSEQLKKLPELLAANINELGSDYAAVKVVARMLNLRIHDLWQRYRIAEDLEKQHILEERNKLLRIQSYYLAEKSIALYNKGNCDLARRLAIEALPYQLCEPNRPYVPEAEEALRLSYANFKYIFKGRHGCMSPNGEWIAAIESQDEIHLWNTESGTIKNIFNPKGYCNTIGFSTDSNLMASGTRNGKICVWDLSTGQCIHEFDIGFSVESLSFSPEQKSLAVSLYRYGYQSNKNYSTNKGTSIMIYSLDTEKIQHVWPLGEFEESSRLSYSNTGKYLVAVSAKRASIWSISTGKVIESQPNVESVSFSKDDRYHVYGFGHCIPFVDTEDNSQTKIIRYHDVSFAAFCGDIDHIMSICSDNSIRIWYWNIELHKYDCIQTLTGHLHPIRWASVSLDGKLIVSCSVDDTIRVWSVRTGNSLAMTTCETPLQVYFGKQNQSVIITSYDYIRIWEYQRDYATPILRGHTEGITSVYYCSLNKKILTCSSGSTMRLWDLPSGKCEKIFRDDNEKIVSAILSSNGKYIFSLGEKTIRFWNIETETCLDSIELKEEELGYTSMTPHPEGEGIMVVTASRIFNFSYSGDISEILKISYLLPEGYDDFEQSQFTSDIAVNPSNSLIACGVNIVTFDENRYDLCVFDFSGEIHHILKGHTNTIKYIAYCDTNPLLASATEYGEIKLWNTANGVCEKTIQIDGNIKYIGFQKEELILIYEQDAKLILDNCNTQQIIDYSGEVNSVTLSKDGNLIFLGKGFPGPLYNEDGEPVDRNDCIVEIIYNKPLQELIEYTREQCKNLSFTDNEEKSYHLT